jgi:hypothetical protein
MSNERELAVCRHWFRCLAIIGAICVAGCNSKTSNLAAVKGKVQLNGQPLANGAVVTDFAGGRGAQGVVKNGEFELGTFAADDGALVGSHKVAVTANDTGAGSEPESSPGKSLIPQRYNNPATSELTIEVKAGEVNAPSLDLTSP